MHSLKGSQTLESLVEKAWWRNQVCVDSQPGRRPRSSELGLTGLPQDLDGPVGSDDLEAVRLHQREVGGSIWLRRARPSGRYWDSCPDSWELWVGVFLSPPSLAWLAQLDPSREELTQSLPNRPGRRSGRRGCARGRRQATSPTPGGPKPGPAVQTGLSGSWGHQRCRSTSKAGPGTAALHPTSHASLPHPFADLVRQNC